MRDDYDSPWKAILGRFFPQFLDFFFPEAYADIDWQRGYLILEQELQQITHDAKTGRRVCDKLVKVRKRSGKEELVLIHAEIQSGRDKRFARRMFTYNYRAFDRYGLPVISLAVLGDTDEDWRPNTYGYEIWRCRVGIDFPVVKLCDYNARWAELEASRNPFAVVVMAHLQTQATRKSPADRLEWKRRLVRGLYKQRWEREQIVDLFRFLDWMLYLPPELDQQFWGELKESEEEKRMRYMTSVEKIGFREGVKKGLQQGRDQGLQEGMERGKQEWLKQGMEHGIQQGLRSGIHQGEAAALERLLTQRFAPLPTWVKELLADATLRQLTRWLDRVIDAERLEDVFADG